MKYYDIKSMNVLNDNYLDDDLAKWRLRINFKKIGKAIKSVGKAFGKVIKSAMPVLKLLPGASLIAKGVETANKIAGYVKKGQALINKGQSAISVVNAMKSAGIPASAVNQVSNVLINKQPLNIATETGVYTVSPTGQITNNKTAEKLIVNDIVQKNPDVKRAIFRLFGTSDFKDAKMDLLKEKRRLVVMVDNVIKNIQTVLKKLPVVKNKNLFNNLYVKLSNCQKAINNLLTDLKDFISLKGFSASDPLITIGMTTSNKLIKGYLDRAVKINNDVRSINGYIDKYVAGTLKPKEFPVPEPSQRKEAIQARKKFKISDLYIPVGLAITGIFILPNILPLLKKDKRRK